MAKIVKKPIEYQMIKPTLIIPFQKNIFIIAILHNFTIFALGKLPEIMKLRYLYLTYFVIIISSLLVINNSCKKIQNPYEGVEGKDTLYYDHIESRVFVEFRDLSTNEYISSNQGELLSVTIGGSSKDLIYDIIGKQETVYHPQNGLLSFGILSEITPSETSPVRFTINSSLFGYIPQSKEISITSVGDYYVVIKLANINSPPEGVVIEQQFGIGNLYEGVLYEDVNVTTNNQEVSLTIKAGTKLLTADTIPLAGKLNITLVYHDLNYDAGFNSMQGGISSSVLENGSYRDVIFSPCAIADIKITDSDWKEARIIEEIDLEFSLVINTNITNPVTNSNYSTGDIAGLYVYNSDTGSWVYQEGDTITAGFMGQLYVNSKTKSLKNYCVSNIVNQACVTTSAFNITGECQLCESVLVSGIMRKSTDNSFVSDIRVPANRNNETRITTSMGNVPVDIYWNDTPDSNQCVVNPVSNPTHIENMCAQSSPFNLALDESLSGLISAEATFKGVCPSDTNYLILPSFGLWMRKSTSPTWQWVSMINGKATLCNLHPDNTYILGTYFNNSWQQWEFIVNYDEDYIFIVNFSDDVCRNVFGIL